MPDANETKQRNYPHTLYKQTKKKESVCEFVKTRRKQLQLLREQHTHTTKKDDVDNDDDNDAKNSTKPVNKKKPHTEDTKQPTSKKERKEKQRYKFSETKQKKLTYILVADRSPEIIKKNRKANLKT